MHLREDAMVKTLIKHGDEWAVVIDKSFLDALEIRPETPLEITTDGKTISISPAADLGRDAKFAAALEEINRDYGRALKRLAE